MLTTKYKVGKFITYALVALCLCVLQNTPGLFVLWDTKPMLVAAFCICVAIFERETAGGLFAIFGGLLCDFFSAYTFGFYALTLFFCCVAAGLLTQGYLRPVAVNAALFTLFSMLLIQAVGFFFAIYIWVEAGSASYFLQVLLPLCIYTALTAIPFFWLVKKLHLYFEAKILAA